MTTREIQQALQDKGFDPGEIDGIWGRRTITAVKEFQKAAHLTVDGIVGPATKRSLFGAAVADSDRPNYVWYNEALRLLGTKEVSGKDSNKTILKWADDLDIRYPGDDIPWCGLFTSHCIGATLPDEVLPANPLGARNWSRFGRACPTPRIGAVMVFWRKSKDSGLGHVAFYYGEDDDTYSVLGGNQSDMVCVTAISKARFLAARQPATVDDLPVLTAHWKAGDKVSTNEQ